MSISRLVENEQVIPRQKDDHEPTVKDSPHPQASLMFGFLNANFALHQATWNQRQVSHMTHEQRTSGHPPSSPSRSQ